MENPYFEKLADSLYACGNGVDLPMWPSAPLATKWAPMCKSPCHLAVPITKDRRITDFLKIYLLFFILTFWGPNGVIFAVCALAVIFLGWHTI